ncbi:MAG: hypothetical protein CL608_11835 [Anaerolineaceae bacterium]|nr:hypothetical protein [Anaerolineaceae bacterium]
MNYQPSRNDIVNEYIDNLSADIAPLFIEVRACILDAAPDLNESIKWKDCLVYCTSKNHIQTVVGKGKISLIFFDGVALQDEHGLLEGDGKKARTMRIKSPDFNREALQDYVQQAVHK